MIKISLSRVSQITHSYVPAFTSRWSVNLVKSGLLSPCEIINRLFSILVKSAPRGVPAQEEIQYFVRVHCTYSAQKNIFFNPIWKWVKQSSTKAFFVTCENVTHGSREEWTDLTPYFYFTTTVWNPNFIGWSVLRFSLLCSPLPYCLPLFSYNLPATTFLPTGLLFFKQGCTLPIHLFSNQTAAFSDHDSIMFIPPFVSSLWSSRLALKSTELMEKGVFCFPSWKGIQAHIGPNRIQNINPEHKQYSGFSAWKDAVILWLKHRGRTHSLSSKCLC